MKKYLSALLALGLAFGPALTATAETFRNDEVKFGRPASAADKTLTFDQNAGANNPKITSSKTALDLKLRANTITKGTGAAGSVTEVYDVGAGAANPKIRFDSSSQKLQFSNNGTSFLALGSGGGGGGGIVLNGNTGFEDGLDQYTQSPSGIATVGTVLPLFGERSLVVNFTAAAQYVRGQAVVTPNALGGKACTISAYYSGATFAKSKLQVLDASLNVIFDSGELPVLTPANGYSPKKLYAFTCPASGTVMYPQLVSTAVESIKLDELKLGLETIQNPAPQGAQWVGSVKITGCATQFQVTATTPTDFSTPTGCVYTVTGGNGELAAPTGNYPGLALTAKNPGYVYQLDFNGTFQINSATGGSLNLYDVTNNIYSPETSRLGASTGGALQGFYSATVQPSTSVASQLRLRAYADTATAIYSNGSTEPNTLNINVYKYPKSSVVDASQGISVEQTGWRIDGLISGASPNLGNTTFATPITPEASGLSLALAPGSAAAMLGCTGTTDATGLTCPAIAQTAISFTPPQVGTYEACFDFAHNMYVGANGQIGSTFGVYETANTGQTIIQDGGARVPNLYNSTAAGISIPSNKVCGVFTFGDVSRRTVRLQYITYSASGSIVAHNLEMNGTGFGPAMKVSVRRKVDQADVVKVLPANIVPTIVPFTTPGAGTWVVPQGVQKVLVYAIGGGGGGGGGQGTVGGFGACSGATAIKSLAVTPGQSISYTVGTGGPGGGGSSAGTAGVSTIFNGTIIGTGGTAGSAGQIGPNACTQASGGDLNLNGGPGGTGSINSANLSGGNGGSSIFGGGGVGAFAGAGQAATSYGGGGAGGGSAGSLAGGAGATGAIVLMY